MSWYRTGTIAVSGTTVTGTGTNWTDNKMGIGPGQALLIPGAGTVKMYEILRVDSATKLTLTSDAGSVGAGQAYAIMSFYSDSVPDFARRLSAQLSYYQSQMDGWQQIMTSTGTVTLQAPDGTQVTISSFKKMSDDIAGKAAKGDNSDITRLSGLTTPLAVNQGGTGAQNEADARSKLGLGSSATRDASDYLKNYLANEKREVAMQAITDFRNIQSYDNFDNYPKGIAGGLTKGSSLPQSGLADDAPVGLINNRGWHDNSGGPAMFQIACTGSMIGFRGNSPAGGSYYYTRFFKLWTEANTTVDSNGFVKRASPVIKIFADGRAETNDESEGAVIVRQDVGQYLITGALGMNSDAAWGGIDGGFEIPVDRNKQPRLWLDYEMNSDGSILVKTYHRTHPEAPEFARNRIGHSNDDGSFTESVKNGEPVDIPADSFVSVRVEMPANSIWNQKQTTVVIPEEGELKP